MNAGTNYADSFSSKFADDFSALERNVKDHPTSAVARFLLLSHFKKNNDPGFEKFAKQSALYFNNPHWLQFQLDKISSNKEDYSDIQESAEPTGHFAITIPAENEANEIEIDGANEVQEDQEVIFEKSEDAIDLTNVEEIKEVDDKVEVEEIKETDNLYENETAQEIPPEKTEEEIDVENLEEIKEVENESAKAIYSENPEEDQIEPEEIKDAENPHEIEIVHKVQLEEPTPIIDSVNVEEINELEVERAPEVIKEEKDSQEIETVHETQSEVQETVIDVANVEEINEPENLHEIETAQETQPENSDDRDDVKEVDQEPQILNIEPNASHLIPNLLNPEAATELAFEPLHTIDYFASQGIKIREETLMNDKLGKQMRSFTDWLKSMKKLHPGKLPEQNEVIERIIQTSAEVSNADAEVLTEAMAEVLLKQDKKEKAVEMYQKLSLMNPSKSAYFAAKIESIKN